MDQNQRPSLTAKPSFIRNSLELKVFLGLGFFFTAVLTAIMVIMVF